MTATVNEYFEKIFSSFSQELSADKKELFYKKYNEFKNKIPFDVARFARELGINLFGSKDFKESQSGKIEYDSVTKNYSIIINANHSINRIVFTIAHEIGHFFCDQDYLEKNSFILEDQKIISSLPRDSFVVDDEDLRKREVRANRFAAELLVPTDKFKEDWKSEKTIEEIARTYGVSQDMIKFRAANVLGVIL
jgi:Zn-dependent peptidase ImmA (M78 family)